MHVWYTGFKSGFCDSNTKSLGPAPKNLFGILFLSEDWNPNLNFIWIPCQIWVQPFTCFWIQAGFKSGLNSCGSQFITATGPTYFLFSPFSLSLLHLLLCFSLYTLKKTHSSSKKTSSKTHSKKPFQIKTYQAQPTRIRQDQKKRETHGKKTETHIL